MSFTEEGIQRMIAGEFADGHVVGRLGVKLVSITPERIVMKYFVASSRDNAILFEYEETPMVVGQQVVLTNAETKIPIVAGTE